MKYKDDFANDKYEGNEKHIWEDGEYYIGQLKNWLRNVEWTLYYSNGKTETEGNYVNNVFAGN